MVMTMKNRQLMNRMYTAFIVLILILAVWNVRLFWLQIASARSYSSRELDLAYEAVMQRGQGLILDTGRGQFYDRIGSALTGRRIHALAVFPALIASEFQEKDSKHKRMFRILGTTEKDWNEFVRSDHSPKLWTRNGRPVPLTSQQVQELDELNLLGARVVDYVVRYEEEQTASHVIGFVSQHPERVIHQFAERWKKGQLQIDSVIGNAGLEKTLEPFISGVGPTTALLFTDAANRRLPGLDFRITGPGNPYYPLKVITTLDAGIQAQAEKRMDELRIKQGAVVILDAAGADTIAMVSRPSFQPDSIHLQEGNWSNLALKAAAPGSIFKTVTAAAALEEGKVHLHEEFECTGSLGKYGFTCWKEGGHGRITFEEAFAESCNIVFAEAARRIGGEKLELYARKLGLEAATGWSGSVYGIDDFTQWDGEEAGQVYSQSSLAFDDGAVVQTAIGQRDVRMTPLQAANMIVTLLHHGEVLSPRVVKEVRFADDRRYLSFAPKKAPGMPPQISKHTAKALLSMMEGVVRQGTGRSLLHAKWGLAGKSGTAQTTMANGKPAVHQWFIGYGPVEQPKYAVAVAVYNRPENSANQATQLYQRIMDDLAER